MSALAPIALFAYNRPDHLTKTLAALSKNTLANESDLFIFSDGPKNEAAQEKVNEVRDLIKNIQGFRKVFIRESKENRGLASSVINGVTAVVGEYGKIIVLEDDLVTSPYFLEFMNAALDKYEQQEEVISIHGYCLPIKGLPETFFIRGADCWGWATWARGWSLFEPNGSLLLNEIRQKKLTRAFNFNNSYPYTRMLKKQIEGKNNSWAIRWYASAFLKNKLTLYPGSSLVKNIGNDDSGTHSKKNTGYDTYISQKPVNLQTIPVSENAEARKKMAAHMLKLTFISKIKRLTRLLPF